MDVVVLERDATAIRGEGKYRGPIQIKSNALASLEAIDIQLAAEVEDAGCITGYRVNGLCDGLTGEWYCKFDTFHPAVDRGIPVTRVVSRIKLQELLADACLRIAGRNIIRNGEEVVAFSHPEGGAHAVEARLASGEILR